MSTFTLSMPDDLTAAVAAQAAREGVSVDHYLLCLVAAHAGAQAESHRYFAARAARSSPARALEVLSRAGVGKPPEPEDELPTGVAPRK